MPKRKYNKKPPFKLLALSNILAVVTTIALAITTYYYFENQNLIQKDHKLQKEIKQLKNENKLLHKQEQEQRAKYFEEKTKALEIEYTDNIDNITYIEEPKAAKKFIYEESFPKKDTIEYPKQKNIIKKETLKYPDTVISSKPKLAIIIDDVTTSYQRDKILDIGYNINMAFLPPTPRHKNSAKITNNLEHYMIHLPLQASSNKYDEANTLYVNDTYTTIEKRIIALQSLYPNAKFINNHTGSKFTANQEAMDKLFQVLQKYNYTFIDSKTTANSVALVSAKKYGMRVLSRNIFLDNKKDKVYIQNQLKKAVAIAKKQGSAIAIGHPYNITFNALKDSQHILKDVQTVFVDQL